MNTLHHSLLATLSVAIASFAAQAQESDTANAKAGDKRIAEVKVDVAPGAVSAAGMLSIGGDKLVNVNEPRDLTLLLKAVDGNNVFGLSITPARTSLTPMNVSTYATGGLGSRLLGGVTLGYAQTTAAVSGKDYRQRAVSIETSAYLDGKDDPLLTYWARLEKARKDDLDDTCLLLRPAAPTGSIPSAPLVPAAAASGAVVPKVDASARKEQDALAAKCRAEVAAAARWNASRVWASVATGRYSSADGGGVSGSLGRTMVLGLKYGIGQPATGPAGALTVGLKRTSGEPLLATYSAIAPTRRNVTLVTLRGAYGSNTLRATLEASRFRKEQPTASERTFKRAVGLDFKLMEGAWLTVRAGKQRKIDNSGDETGVSFNLNVSPGAQLTL